MNNEKRRDKKGRVLQNGESQDSSGRYVFKYQDTFGRRRAVYSWRLTQADPNPAGKKQDLSLREKEKAVYEELHRGVCAGDITVCELVERYLRLKTGVKHNTWANYKFVQNVLKKEPFGKQKIDKIRISDAKLFLIGLQKNGRGYSSIHAIRGVLRPAFQMAVEDEMLAHNPFEFQLKTIIFNDSVPRQALTQAEEQKFLQFIKEDDYYCKHYDGMFILFKTGMRISEFCGLTVHDLDFDSGFIHITHQLQRTRDMKYVVESTKTTCGTRSIPMTEEVATALRRIIANRRKIIREPMVDGYTGFLFLDKNDMPLVALHWEKYFQHSAEKYNKNHLVQMPKITPHICRHTFCSNMAKAGMNPKTLQYIMGHADIGVTMDTYTHFVKDDAKEEMARLGMIKNDKKNNILKIS